ncbi:MAG: hypothetical protein ACOCZQ_02865 [Nanoarchaeota archaeon]
MLAIHHRKGSFSDKWIQYCKKHNVPYKLVDCYSSSIIEEMQACKALMWHWEHHDYSAVLFARQLIFSLEKMGKKVFPSFDTCYLFDDKLGQKYLLEAVKLPLVKSHVFYEKKKAIDWSRSTEYPKVFKLRGGASSENVKIVNDFRQAQKIIKKSFSTGFEQKRRMHSLEARLWQFKRDKTLKSFLNIGKGVVRFFIPNKKVKSSSREKNYVYMQDFISGNNHDIRVITIGQRAFAIKRMVRRGDFRASGSGCIVYDPKQIPLECIQLSFEACKKLDVQCLAVDYVFLQEKPLMIEISYGFSQEVYLPCPGFWNNKLEWIEGSFIPENFMIEDLLSEI